MLEDHGESDEDLVPDVMKNELLRHTTEEERAALERKVAAAGA